MDYMVKGSQDGYIYTHSRVDKRNIRREVVRFILDKVKYQGTVASRKCLTLILWMWPTFIEI